MSVSVIVATFGEDDWRDLAWSRAIPSAQSQATDIIPIHLPNGTLAEARNLGARMAMGHWLVFLDADDELAPGYVQALLTAERGLQRRSGALLVPRVQYVRGRRPSLPRYPSFRPGADLTSLQDGSWLVIGTAIPADVFSRVGGFEEWPLYEDWALFARAWKDGCELVQVPDAVYVAHRRPGSRNNQGRDAKLAAHDSIRRTVFPELYEEVA